MKVENGNTVSVHYRGILSNGTEFDSSYTRGEPISFEVGSGQMIPGFDSAIPGMAVGETKNITIDSKDAYGSRDESAIQDIPKGAFPANFEFVEGATVQGQSPQGQPFLAKICEENTETVKLDFNHPLAGEDLTFEIELVDVS